MFNVVESNDRQTSKNKKKCVLNQNHLESFCRCVRSSHLMLNIGLYVIDCIRKMDSPLSKTEAKTSRLLPAGGLQYR